MCSMTGFGAHGRSVNKKEKERKKEQKKEKKKERKKGPWRLRNPFSNLLERARAENT